MPALTAHQSSTTPDLVVTVFANVASLKSALNPMVSCLEVAVSMLLTIGQ